MQATLLEDPGAQRQLVAALPAGVVPATNSTAGVGTLKPLGAANLAGEERVDKRGAGLMLACVPSFPLCICVETILVLLGSSRAACLC